jgi:hypothetical protein
MVTVKTTKIITIPRHLETFVRHDGAAITINNTPKNEKNAKYIGKQNTQ